MHLFNSVKAEPHLTSSRPAARDERVALSNRKLQRFVPLSGLTLWLLALLLAGACRDAGGSADADVLDDADVPADADWPELPGTQFPWSTESTNSTCADGEDNDRNGYSDCEDFACSRNLAVTVCGDEAVYEASPDLCGNDFDDDSDGLVDCRDPDCRQNPFHHLCEWPRPETGCAAGRDDDRDGLIGCDDRDCVLQRSSGCETELPRVLFDQVLDESAAGAPNSDWIVDGWERFPTPSNPDEPDDWNGALSSLGFELVDSGEFLVESLPSMTGRLTLGDESNPQDLSLYDVLVIFEPSRWIEGGEQRAIVEFVDAGGGLLAVTNHIAADRDGNGVSAPEAWNDLFDNNTVRHDPFGFRFDRVDLDVGPLTNISSLPHPVIAGAAGEVERLGFYLGCTAHLTGSVEEIWGLVSVDSGSGRDGLVVGAAEVGAGRVVFVTDSAMAGDGTDSHGTIQSSHDTWNDTSLDNRVLFLNALSWLARLD